MIKEIQYCDICGKKIEYTIFNEEGKYKIKTPWIMKLYGIFGLYLVTKITGEGCKDCYYSFLDWIKERQKCQIDTK